MTEEQFQQRYGAGLNAQQLEAVHTVDGAVLLLAVPGSGKTTVLVTRLGYMICCRGIPAESILTMTYTVAATREMNARFTRMFGSGYGNVEIRTINGLCQKIIEFYSRREGRVPFLLEDNEGALSRLVRELYRDYYSEDPAESVIRDIRTAISFCKNSLFSQQEIQEYDIGLKHFSDIYRRYCDTLRQSRRMDYDDQLLYALNILKTRSGILEAYQNQFRYLCVDESQDTSRLQHEIIHLLAGKHGNLFMVGDEDQSIYGFRAAYPEALVHFSQDYPGAKTLVMEENYRSTQEISDAANRFVEKNRFRHPKKICPTCGSGLPVEIIHVTKRMQQHWYLFEAAKKARTQTAILSRNNDSLVPLIDLFERNDIPYCCRQFDEVFFSHRILRDIKDIFLFASDERNAELFLRIYYKLGCMISKTAAQYACSQGAASGKPILLELIRCPELGQTSMGRITELYESLRQLPHQTAAEAMNSIRYGIGYGEYVERSQLDSGKFAILDMLAKELPSASALLVRLYELRRCIQNHIDPPEANVILSTIHSSKGLEYDTVYLLDVLDGILPGRIQSTAKTQEEIRQYQEERRLFYVAMTRAKKRLCLFQCQNQPSEFIQEVRSSLPGEQLAELDVLHFWNQDLRGKTYYHSTLGKGTVCAQGEDGLLVMFASGYRLLTLDSLLKERQHRMGACSEPKPEKKPIAVPELTEGCQVVHVTYGSGTVVKLDLESITVQFSEDQRIRTFLKSAVLPTAKLRLE